MGIKTYKDLMRDKKLKKLNRELGNRADDQSPMMGSESEEGVRKAVDIEKDKALHKDLFKNSQRKQQFYEVAKLMQNKQTIEDSDEIHTASYMRFYQQCQKSGTLAIPIFSKA